MCVCMYLLGCCVAVCACMCVYVHVCASAHSLAPSHPSLGYHSISWVLSKLFDSGLDGRVGESSQETPPGTNLKVRGDHSIAFFLLWVLCLIIKRLFKISLKKKTTHVQRS